MHTRGEVIGIERLSIGKLDRNKIRLHLLTLFRIPSCGEEDDGG